MDFVTLAEIKSRICQPFLS